MTDVNASLTANANKCADLLHRLLAIWLTLILLVAFLPVAPASTAVKLPFAEISIPVNSAKWACFFVIFFFGFAGCAVLKQIRSICISLAETEHLAVVFTYPSLATLGTPIQRVLLGYGLAFIQFSVGFGLIAPLPPVLGADPAGGLAFLYSAPMFYLSWQLRDWQRSIGKSNGILMPLNSGRRSDA